MHVALVDFHAATPYPVELANALGKLSQTTLLLPESRGNFAAMLDHKTVDLRIFGMPRYRAPANLAMIARLRRLLNTLNPDLLHITFWHWWGSPGLGIGTARPLVATVHDVGPHPGDHVWWRNPSLLYPFQWRWADQVIVHAVAERERLVGEHGYPLERTNVIPIGSFNAYRSWGGLGHSERPATVLFFGRLWEYKGLRYLIEAEPLITREIPDARIVIAGHGESFEPYRQAMVNADRFEVHNHHIPDRMVAELFEQASVVVLPYTEASQSGVVSIACAFGKPVVATKVGGIPDVVQHGETGYLVPPRDRDSLAEAIISLLKDEKKRHEMGRRAWNKAQTDLSWSAIAEKTVRVYEKAMVRG